MIIANGVVFEKQYITEIQAEDAAIEMELESYKVKQDKGEVKYRIVIRDITTSRVTPITRYFESREVALSRMQESYKSRNAKLVYDLEPEPK